ncbi:Lactate-binding periplasmic protein precursor [Roseivivax jejudonensis]|uniref:Lactate-binding periplasmic protein n=1 Tax=Roseivivax jejudonensis TaxID=1529041 RepID=A0A1X6ZZA2_9RHOB|nr:TRAP transporter substrate-binding protein DctP [Roseivivax jejudonensis]SLN66100.1 Lactate-binding periplasmic protein precursor [Roseivivax jejudonensis]
MNTFTRAAFAATAALSLGTTASAQDLRLLAGWDSSYAAVGDVLMPFIERLEEETTADISINVLGPETVPPFEQLDPVSRGLFDMLYTNGAYHFNEIAVGMTLDAMNGTTEDLREGGVWQAVDAQYQELGLKLIAVLYDLNGYHIMLKDEVGEDALEGRRIRGTPIYHPVIEALGGSPVVLPGNEIYPALERGVVDGAAWPTVGAVAYKWFEVADYMMRPTFGQVSHMVLMNLETWNGLDDQTRSEIEAAAQSFELEANGLFDELAASERETLETEGMTVSELSQEMGEMISGAWFTGTLDLAATQNPEAVEEIRGLATEAGVDG